MHPKRGCEYLGMSSLWWALPWESVCLSNPSPSTAGFSPCQDIWDMGDHPSWHSVAPERLFLSHWCSCLEGTRQPSPRPTCACSVWLCQAGSSPAMCQPWLSSLRTAHLGQKWEPAQGSLCGPNLISSRHAMALCFSRAKWSQLHSSWGCGEPNPSQAVSQGRMVTVCCLLSLLLSALPSLPQHCWAPNLAASPVASPLDV